MIVLDTTVLVYAKGADHPFREPCGELVSAVADGRLAATTTIEVVQEFSHVRARRHGRLEAASLAGEYVDLLSPLIVVVERDLRKGLSLFAEHRLGAFDSVLAAAAIGRDANVLVSADRAFGEVADLRHVFPDADGVASLLV